MTWFAAGLKAEETRSSSVMEQMEHNVTVVNSSVNQLASHVNTQSTAEEQSLNGIQKSVKDLQNRVDAFESHPPTIGEVGCICMYSV